MTARTETAAATVRLADYQTPAWHVDHAELVFDLGIDATEVAATLTLRKSDTRDAPLRLDGEGLEPLAFALDGKPLADTAWRAIDGGIEIDGAHDGSVLETRVRLQPAANTTLEGLYLSGSREAGFLLTQCEAQGFRHITWYPDRPDVQATFTVILRAERARFPVLLAGGNPDGAGELADGRHWARFVDPHRKPSYLFALVAGRLEKIEQAYRTADGRDVTIRVWSEATVIGRCHYAMDALVRAMRWDEETYGRNYDLDVFNVVATHDFNMGAMENKGLNIFNAKCLLADPDTTTDDEYRRVESVIAHEYFHNWSGNRVTCRDWFQLSLKEGFTVFREQSFAADMNSRPLKRIEDVSLLRRAQFPEDAGPLAHPVRPAQYREINNFYTATVYEKGAELVRMLAGRLGTEGFRRGTDRYFAKNDGRSATIEDFIEALGAANDVDLTPYLAWYGQSGTPHLKARGHYDAARHTWTLTLAQHTAPTHDQAHKLALPIPVKLALFAADGRRLPLQMDGQTAATGNETVIVLDQPEQHFTFHAVPERPVPSLLRGFSAPVVLDIDASAADLALLLRHDNEGFNRWEAGQQLAAHAYRNLRDHAGEEALGAWCDTLSDLFDDPALDPALLADLLTPPGEVELAERETSVDPDAIHALRETLLARLAARIGSERLIARHQALAAQASTSLDAATQGARRLKQRVLQLIARRSEREASDRADAQYRAAPGMTDRIGALAVLARHDAQRGAAALADYRARHAHDPLALDKWFTLQAQLPGDGALARVIALEADPAFTLKNPNRARALLGGYASSNPTGFHRADGAGYRHYADRLLALDALNPQIAARLATAFNGWQRLEPRRRDAARIALDALAAHPALSRNLAEIVGNVRKG